MINIRMDKDCPCTKDCPDRKAGCAIDCTHGWDKYREKRLKIYEKRAEYASRCHQTAGFQRAMREAKRNEQLKRQRG